MVNLKNLVRASLMATVAAGAFGGAAVAQLDQTLNVARANTTEGAQTQRRIDQLDDQRTDIELEYRALLEQIESQRLFVEQQEVFIRSQENEMESLESQIERVDGIQTDLAPMMREMVQNLEEFVNLDLPFRLEGENGRLARIEGLYELIDDPAISPAERYRVILNAYDIEASYGRSLNAYDDTVLEDGVPVNVKVLQIGRVAMIRQYDDGRMTIRHNGSSDWENLPGSYEANVTRAIRIAEEVTTPSVFLVPLPGPQVAQ
ncbi:MAG: hypothetical protein CMF75_08560 [Maricaulis sp.]|nr:hypothetical protein [Maricaulis sp.]